MKNNTKAQQTTAATRDGIIYYPEQDEWVITSISSNLYFNFRKMRNIADHEMVNSAKSLAAHYLTNYAPTYAQTLHKRLFSLLEYAASKYGTVQEISGALILSYRSSLSRRDEWYLGSLRALFRTWAGLGLPCLEESAISALSEMRLRGNQKGEAVLIFDPEKGPLSTNELQAVLDAVNKKYANNQMADDAYILILLFIALGARPAQLAALKVKDFRNVKAADGTCVYLLHVPRAKQRAKSPRAEYKVRHLIDGIGAVIESYIGNIENNLPIPTPDMPLFPSRCGYKHAPGMEFHSTGFELSRRIWRLTTELSINSERTGERLIINPRRFRYTLGTRAAAEGASEYVIAELLDHSDTQNVGVYVEAVPEIVERIDRAMAIHLAPMAQAFAGQLVQNEGEAVRGNDPRSRVVSPNNLDNPVGNCGSHGYCGAAAPIACYTCQNFQPWLDGPHEEVLTSLIEERDRVLEQTGDLTIAAINDRLIFAVAQVVDLCERRKQA